MMRRFSGREYARDGKSSSDYTPWAKGPCLEGFSFETVDTGYWADS
jgi:hypothetical protein